MCPPPEGARLPSPTSAAIVISPTRGRVAQGVFQKVIEQLGEPFPIGHDRSVGMAFQAENTGELGRLVPSPRRRRPRACRDRRRRDSTSTRLSRPARRRGSFRSAARVAVEAWRTASACPLPPPAPLRRVPGVRNSPGSSSAACATGARRWPRSLASAVPIAAAPPPGRARRPARARVSVTSAKPIRVAPSGRGRDCHARRRPSAVVTSPTAGARSTGSGLVIRPLRSRQKPRSVTRAHAWSAMSSKAARRRADRATVP